MDILNLAWQIAFLVATLSMLGAYKIIIEYICEKPPGLQSLFDPNLKDFLRINRLVATSFCIVAIVSRTESVATKIRENPVALYVVCFVYDFAIVAGGTNAFCICAIRILCLIKMSLLESFGEVTLRTFCIMSSFVMAASVGIFQAIKCETISGPGYNLFALEARPSGKPTEINSMTIFISKPGFYNIK